ncbi:cytochrome P450 [Trametes polyzona]|nr:cytochrome P450 [Trametes polyzona]
MLISSRAIAIGAGWTSLYGAMGLVVVVLGWLWSRYRKASPPGPVGLPFVGVARQIPGDKQWLTFHDWILEYGDVVSTTVMGRPMLVLGSYRAASDLLDTKGNIYSDRPNAIMAGELVGWGRGLGYAHGPDNPRFRQFRRMFQRCIGPRASQDAHILRMQEEETHRLMLRMLQDPENFYRHPRESAGALILRLAYGYEVSQDKGQDRLLEVVEVAMQGFCKASEPGAFYVDNFPILRYVPECLMPGGGFKAVARKMRRDLDEMYDLPFAFVKEQIAAGKAQASFTSSYLEGKHKAAPSDEMIKAAAASLYSGGADSAPSAINAFILAMTLWPEVQARAQKEVDGLLGPNPTRLPTFADRASLPYVNAIVLEVLRWNPSLPMGLAHRLTEDDVYRDWAIPKGTVVWANIWSMLQDPSIFPEPDEFRPERYLNEDGGLRRLERHEDPAIIGFGFGRRICPGMFFAINSIFIGVATMLAVFDIRKSKDAQGKEIVPEVDFRGFISHPMPFRNDSQSHGMVVGVRLEVCCVFIYFCTSLQQVPHDTGWSVETEIVVCSLCSRA